MSKEPSTGLGELVSRLSATHVDLWHEEDKARVQDDRYAVAEAKRRIDKLNQIAMISSRRSTVFLKSQPKQQSMAETMGSLIDKICIAELKFISRIRADRSRRFSGRPSSAEPQPAGDHDAPA